MNKEKNTITLMLQIYCQAHHHGSKGLCPECDVLKKYAIKKLDNCVFSKNKPVCSKCRVQCYAPDMRDLIIKVMKFSGPKMIFRHPFLIANHILQKALKKIK